MTPPNDDEVAVSVPLEDRARSKAKSPSNFSGNRDLSL